MNPSKIILPYLHDFTPGSSHPAYFARQFYLLWMTSRVHEYRVYGGFPWDGERHPCAGWELKPRGLEL